jgi:hypothetical protein
MKWNRPKSRLAPVLTVALVLTLALAYLAGYFVLGTMSLDASNKDGRFRTFGSKWQCRIYAPAAKLELYLTGGELELLYLTEDNVVQRYPER